MPGFQEKAQALRQKLQVLFNQVEERVGIGRYSLRKACISIHDKVDGQHLHVDWRGLRYTNWVAAKKENPEFFALTEKVLEEAWRAGFDAEPYEEGDWLLFEKKAAIPSRGVRVVRIKRKRDN
jgi:hypothetical protein